LKPANDFDRIATYYDHLAGLVFGKSILESQLCHLSMVAPGSRILILGGGTGQILPYLLAKDPVGITYLEPSIRMSEKAMSRVPSGEPVDFVRGSFEDLPDDEVYDALITPFVLDLFTTSELSECMNKLSSVLSPQGRWFFSDFQICDPPKRYWQAPFIHLMYRFFRLACNIRANRLPNFEKNFRSYRLVETKATSFFGGAIISRVYRFRD